MALTAIAPSDSASALGALTSGANSSGASEQRFLKLLVTQLNNQDPLNPLDNAQLTSQLAQMSAVSGIEKLNTAFQSLLAQSGSNQVLQSASLIGRSVLAPGNNLIAGNDSTAFAVDLPSSAESVKVTITDAAGNTVRSYEHGAMSQGLHGMAWDGKSDAGQAVAPGMYQIHVVAMNGATSVQASSLVYSQVDSVSQGSGGVSLNLASGQSIALSDVRMIL